MNSSLNPRRIQTPFGFSSTASQVVEGVDLSGRRAIVTGGASGIGVETAAALAGAGAEVTLAVRNVEAAREVAAKIDADPGDVDIAHLDLTDQRSVEAFADSWRGPLHLLINNAGVMASPEERTAQGWELQFATNHLGHFALTCRLRAALAEAGGARVVALSSSAHLFSPIVFGDLHFRFRPYDPRLAYAQSKTANVLFAVALSERWADDGILANSVNPGAIPTRIQRHVGNRVVTPPEFQKSSEQGASTSVLAAVSPLLEGVGGRYFNDCHEAALVAARPVAGVDRKDSVGEADGAAASYVSNPEEMADSVAAYALDPEEAERLWRVSVELVGVAA